MINTPLRVGYTITLEDGRVLGVDVYTDDDWGNIQECYDTSCDPIRKFPGWGDADDHSEIVAVMDSSTGDKLDPLEWAEKSVWPLAWMFS